MSDLLWYSLYILLATSMGFFILKDWVNDLQDHKRNQMVRNAASIEESCCFRLARVFISNWVEVVFLAVLILLLVPNQPVLEIVLTTLLVLFVLRELLQITVSVKRYLTSVENWVEVPGLIGRVPRGAGRQYSRDQISHGRSVDAQKADTHAFQFGEKSSTGRRR